MVYLFLDVWTNISNVCHPCLPCLLYEKLRRLSTVWGTRRGNNGCRNGKPDATDGYAGILSEPIRYCHSKMLETTGLNHRWTCYGQFVLFDCFLSLFLYFIITFYGWLDNQFRLSPFSFIIKFRQFKFGRKKGFWPLIILHLHNGIIQSQNKFYI